MKILLVDIENCPSQIDELLKNLSDYAQVIICYAKSGVKIPIDWIVPLSQSVNQETLRIIKMPEIKNNAADFGITFWAGALMSQLPEETQFDIVSNDVDLDCVVSLLTGQLRSAKRIGRVKDISANNMDNISSNTTPKARLNKAIQLYCSYLTSHINKPAKETTLLNSIKSKLNESIEPSKVLQELMKQGIVTINGTKVSYNTKKLNAFNTH